jgi:hypothetical protein
MFGVGQEVDGYIVDESQADEILIFSRLSWRDMGVPHESRSRQ